MPPQHDLLQSRPKRQDEEIAEATSRSSSTSFHVIPEAAAGPGRRFVRASQLRRESFWVQFSKTQGPPQITGIMVLIAIGLGSTIGVVPSVMTDRFARLNHGYADDNPSCSVYQVNEKPEACFLGSADAQSAVSFSNLASNGLTFLLSSLLGSLSDEHGRKGILVAGLVLSTLSPLMLICIQLLPKMSPWWYYGCHASTGLVNWIAIALSALSDVLPPSLRAPGIGLLLAGFLLGFSLAPILAFMLSNFWLSVTSFCVVLMGLLATIYAVPETLPPNVALAAKEQRELQAMHEDEMEQELMETYQAAPSWHVHLHIYSRRSVRFFSRPFREMAILNRDVFFRLISILAFFSGMVSSGDQVLLVYYLEECLNFSTSDISVMFFIMGIMGLLAQGVLLKPLNDWLGEKWVIAVCFFVGAVDNTMYGLASNKATIYSAVALSALTGMAFPTISAIKANNVAVTEQGRIQGALYSLQALASGIGPVVLRLMYSKFRDTPVGPGAMFVFAGLLYLVAVGVACALPADRAISRNSQRHVVDSNDEEGLMDFEELVSSSSEASQEDQQGTYGTLT